MDYNKYINDIIESQRKAEEDKIIQQRNSAISNLDYQQKQIAPTFEAQRQQANVQSQLGAKNLAEYWASRGQTSSGIAAQADMSRQNTLGNALAGIQTAENKALNDMQAQRASIEQQYASGISNVANSLATSKAGMLYEAAQAEQARKDAMAKASAEALLSATAPQEGQLKNIAGEAYKYINGKWQPVAQYQTDPTTGQKTLINPGSANWGKLGFYMTGEKAPITWKDANGKVQNYNVWYNQNTGQSYIIRNNQPVPLIPGLTKNVADFYIKSLSGQLTTEDINGKLTSSELNALKTLIGNNITQPVQQQQTPSIMNEQTKPNLTIPINPSAYITPNASNNYELNIPKK